MLAAKNLKFKFIYKRVTFQVGFIKLLVPDRLLEENVPEYITKTMKLLR